MFSWDAAIALGVGKTATKWTKTQFGQAHFVRKPVWIHPQMEGGGGGGVNVKYWPSGGWAFTQTYEYSNFSCFLSHFNSVLIYKRVLPIYAYLWSNTVKPCDEGTPVEMSKMHFLWTKMYFSIEMYLQWGDTCHVGTLIKVSPHHRFYCISKIWCHFWRKFQNSRKNIP